jgi:uncharacterized protein (TIGR02266 family)
MTSTPVALSQPATREDEILEAERRLMEEEHVLATEIACLVDHAGTLLRRINSLKRTLHDGGDADLIAGKERLSLLERAEERSLPVLRVRHWVEKAAQARLEAVATRLEVCRAIRNAVDACSADLATLDDNISEDEMNLDTAPRSQPAFAETLADALERASAEADFERLERIRKTPRVPLSAEISFATDKAVYEGHTTNVSVDGVFIATEETLPVSTRLELCLRLPTGAEIETAARVRWTRNFNELTPDMIPGMGAEFEALSARDRERILDLIERRQPIACQL